jgi:hypothetical protein
MRILDAGFVRATRIGKLTISRGSIRGRPEPPGKALIIFGEL